MKKLAALILAFAMCLSLFACGNNQPENNGNASNGNANVTIPVVQPETVGDKITLDDLVLVDDNKVKITLVEFYTNKMISAGNSDGGKCATFKIENKTDREMNVWMIPYLNNESLQAMFVAGNSTAIEAGRVGRMGFSFTYGSYPNWSDLESLDELYDLEFSFDLSIGAGSSNYENHKVECSVKAALNGEVAGAEALVNEAYADVINMMVGGVWFFNGGSDAAVNKLEFSEDAAIITQIVYDGNGAHTNGVSNFAYLMSDTAVTLTLADGSELVIPYSVNDGAFTLESDAYLTPAEVDAGLQGYWGLRKSENLMGMNSVTEYIYYYNNGQVTYENAAKAQNGGPGEYYYYGPHAGTYTIDNNGLSTTVKNGWACGFNIIDGQVVMVRGGDVCSPVSGFIGQYGYSF